MLNITENDREMCLTPFINPLFVQEDIMIYHYLCKILWCPMCNAIKVFVSEQSLK